MLRNILLGAGVLAALLAVLIFSGKISLGGSKQASITGNVILWGTIPQNQMDSIIAPFNIQASTYRVTYQEVPEDQFSSRLLNALASGQGPDMILAPYQLILEHRDRLYPFPLTSLPIDQFKNIYVNGSSILLTEQGALGLPVSIEPMMLFFNRALYAKHGIVAPPTTWDDLVTITPMITSLLPSGVFQENGVSLGTYSNIPYVKDILMTLVLQLNQLPILRELNAGQEHYTVLANAPVNANDNVLPLATALRFFTDFSNPQKSTYTWNVLQPNALDQFAAEKLSTYIGYKGDAQTLQSLNPRLDFGVATLPQAKGYPTKVTGMRMYAIATLKRTTNPQAAFAVEAAFGGDPYGPQIANSIGAITPLSADLAASTVIDSTTKQSVLVAKGWYDLDTVSTGQLVEQMVQDVVNGRSTVSDAASLFVSRMSDIYSH